MAWDLSDADGLKIMQKYASLPHDKHVDGPAVKITSSNFAMQYRKFKERQTS